MIIDFSVENYASIRDRQTLSFLADKNIKHLEQYYTTEIAGIRLLKVALIFGANASGKTTILKALDFFRTLVLAPRKSKAEPIEIIPFLLDNTSREKDTVFEINFISNGQTYYYRIVANQTHIVSEVLKTKKNGRTIFSRTTDSGKQLSDIKWGKYFPLNEKYDLMALTKNTLWNESTIAGFSKTNMDHECLKNVSDWFNGYLHNIILPKNDLTGFILEKIDSKAINREDLIPILNRADFNISDIFISKRSFGSGNVTLDAKTGSEEIVRMNQDKDGGEVTAYKISFQHDDKNGEHFSDIKFFEESLGTQRYFGLAGVLCLLVRKSYCFYLDELESSIHPELAKHFLLSFCVNAANSQLIATTHNREFLNDKDIFRNDMILFTERDEDCATMLYKLSDFDSSVVRNTSNILNAYNAGRLGAIPNLGDYYLDFEDEEEAGDEE